MKAHQYVKDVLSGKLLACKWVKLACERFNNDLKRSDIVFDEDAAQFAIDFFGHLKLWKGSEYKGKPFVLAPHFQFITANLFGWKWTDSGLRRYKTAYIEMARKGAKALSLDTKIPTPNGWSDIGSLQVGDSVFDDNGNICKIINTTEVFYNRDCYKVSFSDGAEIIADAGHLWKTTVKNLFEGRCGKRGLRKKHTDIRTTFEIKNTIEVQPYNNKTEWNHKIKNAGALKIKEQNFIIDPYVLGCWLGDGHSTGCRITFHPKDSQIIREILKTGIKVSNWKLSNSGPALSVSIGVYDKKTAKHCRRGHDNKYRTNDRHCLVCNRIGDKARRCDEKIPPYSNYSFQGLLSKNGLLNNKHIPSEYLRGSYKQRLFLIQGLMDTDGTVDNRGHCSFTNMNKRLAMDVLALIMTLGLKATIKARDAICNGKNCGIAYKVVFKAYSDTPVFRLARKFVLQAMRPKKPARSSFRQIISVEKIKSVPVRCISVDSKSELFLASENYIPTHNSTYAGGVGAFMFVADSEEGPEVYAAAVKKEQAKIVWNNTSYLLKKSMFSKLVTFHRNNLYMESTWGKCEPLSSDSKSLDGLDTHFASLDELHAHPTPAVHDLVDDSTGARSQPIILMITTAGFDQSGICYQRREYLTKILKGTVNDDSFFGMIFTIDTKKDWPALLTKKEAHDGKEGTPEDDWQNEDVWVKAMPGLCGITESGQRFGVDENGNQIPGYMTKIEDVRKKAIYALSNPAALNNFLTKRLNVWTQQFTRWIDLGQWDLNYTKDIYEMDE